MKFTVYKSNWELLSENRGKREEYVESDDPRAAYLMCTESCTRIPDSYRVGMIMVTL